ncbi:MAG TPA: rhodanese-like domain-containing protein [Methanofastidiosum sp.]|nr:rhodanese-like domain-containing protein [Methanofastidiosum sp.]HOR88721.1 rhodanese-like domain-containing protein [Methanofastidiosum sp.]HPL00766.1 rhodanese-like domain-containing protein [Methanofastidiosum sp.]
MQKMIFSIFILATLLVSFAPGVMSESKVALVANSIDIEMNPSLITTLKENGLTTDYFGAKDKGYDAYDYVIILGGPDSSEHTGEISKKILKDADKDNLRNRKYKILYETDGFFKQGQKIFVLAGTDREYTKAAVDTYTAQIISKIKNQSSKPETSATSSIGKNLTAKELKQLIESGEDIYLIDTRTAGEYASGHLKGAVNFPSDRLSTKISQIPTDRKVILYCESGTRSVSSATYLRNKGFDNVYAVTDPYSSLK